MRIENMITQVHDQFYWYFNSFKGLMSGLLVLTAQSVQQQ